MAINNTTLYMPIPSTLRNSHPPPPENPVGPKPGVADRSWASHASLTSPSRKRDARALRSGRASFRWRRTSDGSPVRNARTSPHTWMREKVGVPVNIVKMRKNTVNSILGKMEQKVRLCRPYNLHLLGSHFSPLQMYFLWTISISRLAALPAGDDAPAARIGLLMEYGRASSVAAFARTRVNPDPRSGERGYGLPISVVKTHQGGAAVS